MIKKFKDALGLAQAAALLPPGRNGRPVSPSTLVRWIVDGVAGPDGTLVRLEAIRLGGRWVTDEDAIRAFAERLTPSRGHRADRGTPPASRRVPG